MKQQQPIYRTACFTYLRHSLYDSMQFIIPLSLLYIIGIPLTYLLYINTENIWLDILCAGISIIVLLCRFNIVFNKNYLPSFWFLFIIINFPMMFIYNLLSNSEIIAYKLAMMIMLLVIFSMVTDFVLLIIILSMGAFSAYLLSSFETHKWFIPIHLRYELPIYILGIIFGLILSFGRGKKYQKRLEIMHLCIHQINHELRTPLTKIKWNMKYIVDVIPNTELAALNAAEEINHEIIHSSEVMKILSAVSFALDEQYPNFQQISMYECIEEAITRYPYDNNFPVENITWQESKDFYFKGSKSLMIQIIFNLLKNSIVALNGRSKKCIQIYNISDQRYHYLFFKDNGIGISKNNQKYIFKPLFTTKKDGTGLGLYFCREILKKFYGNIVCESTWKVGTNIFN